MRTRDSSERGSYGQELILDLHDCDSKKFTRHHIERFCTQLCDLIDMERCDLHFWDDLGVPEEEQQTDPKTKGTSVLSGKFGALIRDGFSSSVRRATQECPESLEVAQQSCRRKDARSSGVNFPDSTLVDAVLSH